MPIGENMSVSYTLVFLNYVLQYLKYVTSAITTTITTAVDADVVVTISSTTITTTAAATTTRVGPKGGRFPVVPEPPAPSLPFFWGRLWLQIKFTTISLQKKKSFLFLYVKHMCRLTTEF